jgi:hypothetical protein
MKSVREFSITYRRLNDLNEVIFLAWVSKMACFCGVCGVCAGFIFDQTLHLKPLTLSQITSMRGFAGFYIPAFGSEIVRGSELKRPRKTLQTPHPCRRRSDGRRRADRACAPIGRGETLTPTGQPTGLAARRPSYAADGRPGRALRGDGHPHPPYAMGPNLADHPAEV